MTARKNQTAAKTATKNAPKVESVGEAVTIEATTETPVEGDGGSPVAIEPETLEVAPVAPVEAPATVSVASAFKLMTFTELPGRGATISRSLYPFPDMKPGLMFFAPFADKKDEAELPKRLSTAASQAGKAAQGKGREVKFAVRTIEEDGKAGVGVYCIPLNESEEEAETVGVHSEGNEGEGAAA